MYYFLISKRTQNRILKTATKEENLLDSQHKLRKIVFDELKEYFPDIEILKNILNRNQYLEHRLLSGGRLFYIDLDPNYCFWRIEEDGEIFEERRYMIKEKQQYSLNNLSEEITKLNL